MNVVRSRLHCGGNILAPQDKLLLPAPKRSRRNVFFFFYPFLSPLLSWDTNCKFSILLAVKTLNMNNKFSVCDRSLGETETKHPNISPEKRQNRIEKKIERGRER